MTLIFVRMKLFANCLFTLHIYFDKLGNFGFSMFYNLFFTNQKHIWNMYTLLSHTRGHVPNNIPIIVWFSLNRHGYVMRYTHFRVITTGLVYVCPTEHGPGLMEQHTARQMCKSCQAL